MRFFSTAHLNKLFDEAALSPRKRTHLNLHATFDDKVQHLYIAMLKGSFVEPHYHELPHQWEMFVVLQGVIHFMLYDEDGSVKQSMLIGVGHDVQSIEIQPHDIHSVECLSDKALLLEIKEGPFKPELAKIFPSW
ncbi:WbuC family cupin fold metalloprotein [Shewanella colwelliana]|uniref:WbuC family cupin fold metalloprotein n=1 Tax=Shewanella colwelliana TaxID=23 RepID=UPI00299EFF52|nr:WbuC family cupin fold metalloprotein [Shewanella colwelliana]MDX1281581.1 WbuC family cupin fold metalloprotein [Shewanella colwelliana]